MEWNVTDTDTHTQSRHTVNHTLVLLLHSNQTVDCLARTASQKTRPFFI